MDHDDSLSGLLCPESKTCLDEDSAVLDVEDEDEYVNTLGDKEISFGFKRGETDKSVMLSDDIKCARLEAIAWILNVCLQVARTQIIQYSLTFIYYL